MDKYTATELAYKNGYERGYNDGKPKWIPVSERLPEKFHNVLAACKCGDWYSIELDCIDNSGGWNGDLFRMNDVTHWMPLPEPPKEV